MLSPGHHYHITNEVLFILAGGALIWIIIILYFLYFKNKKGKAETLKPKVIQKRVVYKSPAKKRRKRYHR